MSVNQNKVIEVYNELAEIVHFTVGVYCDATSGFDFLLEKITKTQDESINKFRNTQPEIANIEYLDSTWMIYGDGDPNKQDSKALHISTQKEFKERNSRSGMNYKFIGNMCLITLYQYWEDHYRQKFADCFGLEKKQIRADIFGDIRILRNSIIHHASIALPEINNCIILKWFRPNDEIFLDQNKLFTIREHVLKLKFKTDGNSQLNI